MADATPLSEGAAVNAARALLAGVTERIRAEAARLAEIRAQLPMPEPRVLTALYESETGLDDFPAVALAADLETIQFEVGNLADRVERLTSGCRPNRPTVERFGYQGATLRTAFPAIHSK